ncbi:PLG [Mytilus edulis]|uniref:PLG n=1 Tax=Mytilus edulis TaxID=6550 RepID=A0A8S3SWX1_MYTED|nr:PLG [Mytilus edulis]
MLASHRTNERKTDDDLEHSKEQMGQNTAERMTQAKHMGSEYNDEATRDVPGYTDLTRTMSSEQNITGYDTLQDQNNGYTELRKSIVTKDQYDTLGEHNIYDYSTVSDSTTNTKAISADRENGVDCSRDVPGYTDLAKTMSSEQNIAGYDTLQDQNNGYTELRKSIVTKDQYDTLGEHNIYDYSTVSDSTTNTKAISADRENGVDCSRDCENISETSGHKNRNIGKTNLKYYNEQLHISTGNKNSLDASESGIRKQKSVESIGNNEPDYSYVSGFKDRQNDTKHVQGMVQSLNKDFVPASQDNDVHQDMQREECVSERTNKSNIIQAVGPRARLIGVAIVVLAVFVGCLVLVLSLKEKSKSNCNSSDKGFHPQPLTLTGDCYHNTSTQYFGRLNYTVSGRACQNWSKNAPHVTILRPDRDADKTTNYCRDNSYYKHGTPWCYTEDPDFRWEFCPVFKCNACTMLPKAKPGTTVSYNITFGVVAATYTCQSFKPGVSFPHCPISTCSNGNKWLKFNTSCSVEDRYLNSTKYNGKVSCSVSGTPCMIWNLQKRHLLPINSDDHVTNYCRDPDGKGQPWCYVDHQGTVEKWEFCYVPRR